MAVNKRMPAQILRKFQNEVTTQAHGTLRRFWHLRADQSDRTLSKLLTLYEHPDQVSVDSAFDEDFWKSCEAQWEMDHGHQEDDIVLSPWRADFGYFRALWALFGRLSQEGLDADNYLSLAVDNHSLLWQIPAFLRTPYFLDPSEIRLRRRRLETAGRASGAHVDPRDIWKLQDIRTWYSEPQSGFVCVQGTLRTQSKIRRFGVQVTQDPDQSATAYFLNVPAPPDSQVYPKHIRSSEMLRQLAIQILRYVSRLPRASDGGDLMGSLIVTTVYFLEAESDEDWFGIIKQLVAFLPALRIVVDMDMFQGRGVNETWPGGFYELWKVSRSTKLKIMLLSSYHITIPPMTRTSKVGTPGREITVTTFIPEPTAHQDRISPASMPIAKAASEGVQPSNHSLPSSYESLVPAEESYQSTGGPSTSPGYLSPQAYSKSDIQKPLSREDFNVAIICALPAEIDAIEASFDQHWDADYYGKPRGDPMAYSTGAIGTSKVVLVHMSEMGKAAAAQAASHCSTSFPSVKLALLVGICGGVPNCWGREVMLGDVLISTGLVPYDFGRQFPDQFVRKGLTLTPNALIKSLLAKLRTRMTRLRFMELTKTHLDAMSTAHPDLCYFPGTSEDKLFAPTYRHKHQDSSSCAQCAACQNSLHPTCETTLTATCHDLGCDETRLVARGRPLVEAGPPASIEKASPEIHFGLFASGDKVMKSGEQRDSVAKREDIVALEMEGAGVWNVFPSNSLVVKGVCDYADSHKNKTWQPYAAATAAACTKAFLKYWEAHTR